MNDKQYSVYVLGGAGSGKTCFFAGLSILDEADRASKIKFTCQKDSQAFMQGLAEQLRRGDKKLI